MKYIKTVAVYIIAFIAMLGFFVLDITLAAMIPQEKITESCASAYCYLAKESYYPSPFFDNGFGAAVYDNSTEAIIFNIIYNQDSEHPFKSGIRNWYTYTDSAEMINGLLEAYSGVEEGGPYTHYWVGIILPVKILMIWFSYGEIRFIFYMLSMALFVYLVWKIWRCLGVREAIAYIFTFFYMCIPNNIANITAAGDILLMLIFSLIFLGRYQKMKDNGFRYRFLMFLILGGLADFVDFLYAPIMPLGMIVIMSILLDCKDRVSYKKQFGYFFWEIILYCTGYGLTAYTKGVLTQLIGEVETGSTRFSYWITGTFIYRLQAIIPPVTNLLNRATVFVPIVCLVIIIVLALAKRIEYRFSSIQLKNAAMIIFIGFFLPAVYFMILCNATIHRYYVQNLYPAIFAIAYLLLSFIDVKTTETRIKIEH